jgi:hypothetical protein
MAIVASGQMTLVDMNDSKQLMAYIGSSRPKTVIYDPNANSYTPNYSTANQVLTPQLFIAGQSTDIASSAKSIKWYVQTGSSGTPTLITSGSGGYTIASSGAKALTIASNVLASNSAMTYICELVYTDTDTGFDIVTKSEIELVKVNNGQKGADGYTPVKGTDYFDGEDGTDGTSAYLWIRYSANANGNPMTTDPTGALYIGTATTSTATAPSGYASYNWTLIKGEQGIQGEEGIDGKSSYLHIKYSNDGGSTFTANNGETVGIYIGTYVDFSATDSSSPSAYTWNKVVGDNAVVATVWTPDGNTLKNGSGSLTASVDVFSGGDEVTPSAFKWYIQDPTATTSSGGDTDGGNGWRKLTSTYNAGVTNYTTATITIPASAIASVESFKCVATYNGKKYTDVCTVIDVTDPIVVSVVGLSTFKNGQGTTDLKAVLYRDGAEIDSGGTLYNYAWSIYNSSNVKITPQYSTTSGKNVTVDARDIDARANIVCEVSPK